MKPLLVMTLIAMQLLSAGVTPMYLCLGCNGLVCVDRGSDTCECCVVARQDEVSECSCCTPPVRHTNQDRLPTDGSLAAAVTTIGEHCCCTRLPISSPRVPTLTSSRAKIDGSKLQICVAPWSCKVMTPRASAWTESQFRRALSGPPLSFALRDLTTINLRC